MEQQMDDTSKEFHLRLPKDLHQWFKDEPIANAAAPTPRC